MSNRFELHVEKWSNCTRCLLHETRQNTVLVRGSIPAPVVIVGEAPGESEDVSGSPFDGPAGILLDQILEETLVAEGIKFAITNLVACVPRNDDMSKTAEPPDESIIACAPRVIDLVEMCNPKLIVCVGKLSEHWLDTKYMKRVRVKESIPRVAITHPAAILRMNYAVQSLAIRKQVITLEDAIRSFLQKG